MVVAAGGQRCRDFTYREVTLEKMLNMIVAFDDRRSVHQIIWANHNQQELGGSD